MRAMNLIYSLRDTKPERPGIVSRLMLVALVCALHAAVAVAGDSAEATAFIVPSRQWELATDIAGVIGKVCVEEGDAVKKGQILAELNSNLSQAELAVSRQRVEVARLQVDSSRAIMATRATEFERQRVLLEKKVASQEDHDKARLEMELSQLGVTAAEAQLSMYKLSAARDEAAVERTRIRAPADARVLRIYRREGEAAPERDPVISLVALDPLHVVAHLPLHEAERIAEGMTATLTCDDRPQAAALECKVELVDCAGDPASGTRRVRLLLPNPGCAIVAGSKGIVRFQFNQTTAALERSRPK